MHASRTRTSTPPQPERRARNSARLGCGRAANRASRSDDRSAPRVLRNARAVEATLSEALGGHDPIPPPLSFYRSPRALRLAREPCGPLSGAGGGNAVDGALDSRRHSQVRCGGSRRSAPSPRAPRAKPRPRSSSPVGRSAASGRRAAPARRRPTTSPRRPWSACAARGLLIRRRADEADSFEPLAPHRRRRRPPARGGGALR